jgi:RHS repeat-associated protein
LQKEYGYRNGQLLVVYDAAETGDKQWQWMVTDALGTARMVVDRSGSLAGIKRHDYLPFGEELFALPPGNGVVRTEGNGYVADQVRQKFTSKQRDAETGLDFFEARYYSATMGRFTSPDEFTGGPKDLYDFADIASNNPTFYADLHNPQSLNKYQYCYNDPLTYTDVDGHKGWRDIARVAVETIVDYGSGVAKGAIASTPLGLLPQYQPNPKDSIVNRIGQGVGTVAAGYLGYVVAAGGTAISIGSGGTAAIAATPAAVAGAVVVVGAAKNLGAVITTPIESRRLATPAQADRIRARDNNTCAYCGKPTIRSDKPNPDRSNIDHTDPHVNGGKTTDDNLKNTCQTCNLKKGKMSEQEFREKLKQAQ